MHCTMPILLVASPLPWLVGVLVLIVFAAIAAAIVLTVPRPDPRTVP